MKTIHNLPDWRFVLNEVSAGVYRITVKHKFGSLIELTGIDPDGLVDEATKSAITMEVKIQSKIMESKRHIRQT